eukprot:sb/3461693/
MVCGVVSLFLNPPVLYRHLGPPYTIHRVTSSLIALLNLTTSIIQIYAAIVYILPPSSDHEMAEPTLGDKIYSVILTGSILIPNLLTAVMLVARFFQLRFPFRDQPKKYFFVLCSCVSLAQIVITSCFNSINTINLHWLPVIVLTHNTNPFTSMRIEEGSVNPVASLTSRLMNLSLPSMFQCKGKRRKLDERSAHPSRAENVLGSCEALKPINKTKSRNKTKFQKTFKPGDIFGPSDFTSTERSLFYQPRKAVNGSGSSRRSCTRYPNTVLEDFTAPLPKPSRHSAEPGQLFAFHKTAKAINVDADLLLEKPLGTKNGVAKYVHRKAPSEAPPKLPVKIKGEGKRKPNLASLFNNIWGTQETPIEDPPECSRPDITVTAADSTTNEAEDEMLECPGSPVYDPPTPIIPRRVQEPEISPFTSPHVDPLEEMDTKSSPSRPSSPTFNPTHDIDTKSSPSRPESPIFNPTHQMDTNSSPSRSESPTINHAQEMDTKPSPARPESPAINHVQEMDTKSSPTQPGSPIFDPLQEIEKNGHIHDDDGSGSSLSSPGSFETFITEIVEGADTEILDVPKFHETRYNLRGSLEDRGPLEVLDDVATILEEDVVSDNPQDGMGVLGYKVLSGSESKDIGLSRNTKVGRHRPKNNKVWKDQTNTIWGDESKTKKPWTGFGLKRRSPEKTPSKPLVPDVAVAFTDDVITPADILNDDVDVGVTASPIDDVITSADIDDTISTFMDKVFFSKPGPKSSKRRKTFPSGHQPFFPVSSVSPLFHMQDACEIQVKKLTPILCITRSKIRSYRGLKTPLYHDLPPTPPGPAGSSKSGRVRRPSSSSSSRKRRRKRTTSCLADDEGSGAEEDSSDKRKQVYQISGPLKNIALQDILLLKERSLVYLCNYYKLPSDGPAPLLVSRLHQMIRQSAVQVAFPKPRYLKYQPVPRRDKKGETWVGKTVAFKVKENRENNQLTDNKP